MTIETIAGFVLIFVGSTAFGHSQDINKVKPTIFNIVLAIITLVCLIIGGGLLISQ